MPITIQWDNEERTILRYDYKGQWSWDDLYAVIAEEHEMLESVPHNVVTIINVQGSSMLPKNPLAHSRRLTKDTNPQVRLKIIVGANSFMRMIADITFKAYGEFGITATTRFVATLDEARALAASTFSVYP